MFNILYHIILYIEHNYQTSRSTYSIKLVIFDPSHTSHVHNVGSQFSASAARLHPSASMSVEATTMFPVGVTKNPKMSMVIWLVGGVQIFVMLLNDDLVGFKNV